jgi:hypothetical protein
MLFDTPTRRLYLMTNASNAMLLIYLLRFCDAIINTTSLRGNMRCDIMRLPHDELVSGKEAIQ